MTIAHSVEIRFVDITQQTVIAHQGYHGTMEGIDEVCQRRRARSFSAGAASGWAYRLPLSRQWRGLRPMQTVASIAISAGQPDEAGINSSAIAG